MTFITRELWGLYNSGPFGHSGAGRGHRVSEVPAGFCRQALPVWWLTTTCTVRAAERTTRVTSRRDNVIVNEIPTLGRRLRTDDSAGSHPTILG